MPSAGSSVGEIGVRVWFSFFSNSMGDGAPVVSNSGSVEGFNDGLSDRERAGYIDGLSLKPSIMPSPQDGLIDGSRVGCEDEISLGSTEGIMTEGSLLNGDLSC